MNYWILAGILALTAFGFFLAYCEGYKTGWRTVNKEVIRVHLKKTVVAQFTIEDLRRINQEFGDKDLNVFLDFGKPHCDKKP